MSRKRDVLTEMWAQLEPLLPDRSPRRGRPWIDHRPVLEAIMWRFRTGAPVVGSSCGVPGLADGVAPVQRVVWRRHLRRDFAGGAKGRAQAAGEVDWTVSVDATIARAHQHAGGADTENRGLDRITRIPGTNRMIML